MSATRLRIDKWLHHARIVKTRTLAQKLVKSGAVRVDGNRITGADYNIAPGMVLTIILHERVRVFEVVALGTRRGPSKEALELYNDLSPPPPSKDDKASGSPLIDRPKGAGRPTKRERRQTDAFIGRNDPIKDD